MVGGRAKQKKRTDRWRPPGVVVLVYCRFPRMLVRFLRFVQAGIGSNQVEGRMPKARALATACIRLWTPSFP
jgi:hypothetical protein